MTDIERILSYRPPKRKKHGTQKKGTPCPHCTYFYCFDFHSGRWKSCNRCGYSNLKERQIREIKWFARRNRLSEVADEVIKSVSEYIEKLAE